MTYKCLNIAYHSCDKTLKANVFFLLYPSRAVQLKFNNAQGFSKVVSNLKEQAKTLSLSFHQLSIPLKNFYHQRNSCYPHNIIMCMWMAEQSMPNNSCGKNSWR
jgi:hypothetical protein